MVGALVAGLVVPVATGAHDPDTVAADGGIQTISFEAVNNDYVQLGSLASRTQRKPLDVSGIGPYTVRGTDSNTGAEYTFVTDQFYDGSNASHGGAWTREGDERVRRSGVNGSWTSSTSASWLGRSNVLMLKQSVNCEVGNTFDGLTTYCTIFGPDVYTEAFTAEAGQAVSFDWAARRISDDYEVYAFLVEVGETSPGSGTYDYGAAATHSILAHGRGNDQPWTTSSRNISESGTYRFRFVNGSYDQTGGYALGSEMYIDSVVKVGQANPIDFPPIGDKVVGAADFEVTATAPGGPVAFSTDTTDICTISGSTVSLTGSTGICTIVADQEGDGTTYVPAESTPRSFSVLAAPTAPTSSGAPYITGTLAEGEVLTLNEGTWADGGDPITATSYQWNVTNGGATNAIADQTGTTCFVVASPGDQISVSVTKTNSVGSTTGTSSLQAAGYSCGEPEAPSWTDSTVSTALRVGVAYSDGVAATGAPTPTYSISAGQLPAGLSLDPDTGAISGTPTSGDAFDFTVTASNGFGGDVSLPVSGSVDAEPAWGPDTDLGDLLHGDPVTTDVSADGSPAPTYSVTAGALPEGLSLDPDTGVISGTPTGSGPYDVTVTATNGVGDPVTQRFQGVVNQEPSWDGPQTLATPSVGQVYADGVTSQAYPAPTYSVTEGALPAGLALDPGSGAVTGTPTTAGAYGFTLAAANGIGEPVSQAFSGTVTAATSWVSPDPVGDLLHGTDVVIALSADGTPAPTYSVSDGALPAGLSLDPATGAVTGTPSESGPYSFTITADNGVGDPVSHLFTGSVERTSAWNGSPALPTPRVGSEYSTVFDVHGFPAPTFAVTDGALPAGLSLDPATGAVTGVPTAPGPFEATVTASNGIGDPISTVASGTVTQATGWTTAEVGPMQVGTKTAGTFAADGYPLPTYTVSSGKLPAGLTLNSVSGTVAGTPTTPGFYSFTVTAANGVGTPVSVTISGTVTQAPAWTATAVDQPRLGEPYSATLAASGTPAPAFQVTAGALPQGLVLDPTSGTISGTPSKAGPYAFAITASNGIGTDLARGFSGVVLDEAHAAIGIDLDIGTKVSGAEITVEASGLKPASTVQIELRSDPVLLGTRTTDTNGSLLTTVTLPDGITPGEHHVVVIGTTRLDDTLEVSEPLVVDWSGSLAPSAVTGGFVPVDPVRVLDTRPDGMIGAGESMRLDTSEWAMPTSASAVVVNLTATGPTAAGYLTAWPCGAEQPGTSVLNIDAGETVANLATLSLDGTGELCVSTSTDTHVIVDLAGFHAGDTGDPLHAHSPVRVLDTRPDGILAAGEVVEIEVDDDATAAVVNLTVTEPRVAGYLTAFPCGGEVPEVSNLNYVAGQTVANQATVKTGDGNGICIVSSAPTHVVVDQAGSFGEHGSAALGTNVPGRMLDTRGGERLAAGSVRTLAVIDDGGVPGDTRAMAFNVTATGTAAAGYLTVYPCAAEAPEASNINYTAGDTVANHVTVDVGDDGQVCISTSAATDLIVDVMGTYRPLG